MRIGTVLILVFMLNTAQAQKRDLDFYLAKAIAFSPLINQSQNDKQLVGLDLNLMKSILSKPEINLGASVLFAPIVSHDSNKNRFEAVSNGASSYTGYDMAMTDGGQYQSMVSLKQPLFTGSIMKTYTNKADIVRQVSDNSIALTTHELEKIISYQYLLCLKDKKSMGLNSQILKELQSQLLTMQKLVENAIYKQSDLLLMQIEFDNYKLNLEISKSAFRNDLFGLNVLSGIQDTATVELQDIDFQQREDRTFLSGFLAFYHLDSLRIQSEQTISDLKYKPQVNFFANAGMNAVYLPALNRLGFSTGLTFSWNIFDGNQHEIQKQKTEINLQTLDFEKQNFVTQQQINKDKILDQLVSLEKRITLIDNQLNKYDQLMKVYHAQLSQGEISVIDFKNILKDITAKKQENLMLGMDKQALIVSYNFWNY